MSFWNIHTMFAYMVQTSYAQNPRILSEYVPCPSLYAQNQKPNRITSSSPPGGDMHRFARLIHPFPVDTLHAALPHGRVNFKKQIRILYANDNFMRSAAIHQWRLWTMRCLI